MEVEAPMEMAPSAVFVGDDVSSLVAKGGAGPHADSGSEKQSVIRYNMGLTEQARGSHVLATVTGNSSVPRTHGLLK